MPDPLDDTVIRCTRSSLGIEKFLFFPAWANPALLQPGLLPGIASCETISEWAGRSYWPDLDRDAGVQAFHDWLGDKFPLGLGDWFQRTILRDRPKQIGDSTMPTPHPDDRLIITNEMTGDTIGSTRGAWESRPNLATLEAEGWRISEVLEWVNPQVFPGPGQQPFYPPTPEIYPGPGQQPFYPPVITEEVTPMMPYYPIDPGLEDPTGPLGPIAFPPYAPTIHVNGANGAIPAAWLDQLRSTGFRLAKAWWVNRQFGTVGALDVEHKHQAIRRKDGTWREWVIKKPIVLVGRPSKTQLRKIMRWITKENKSMEYILEAQGFKVYKPGYRPRARVSAHDVHLKTA